jgi:chaperonin GroEL
MTGAIDGRCETINDAMGAVTVARRRPTTPARILFSPHALASVVAGFDDMASLLALTLGPARGPILNVVSPGTVERLSDASTIARRIVALPDRSRNSGAMIVRHLAWRMHEEFGDGAATAAVLARAMVREAHTRVTAGIDPMTIRDGLARALPAALAALQAEASPPAEGAMPGMATAITGDPDLGTVLGEIVDLLGPDGALTIEELPVPYLDREYLEGATWRAHPAARSMIPEGKSEIVFDRPLIMVVDQTLDHFTDVRTALELALSGGMRKPLLIVTAKIGDQALATITANTAQGKVCAIAARLSSSGPALTDDLSDLALITGGKVVGDLLGRPPARLVLDDLGSARKVVFTRDRLTIVGGAGDLPAMAERASALRRRMQTVNPSSDEWRRFQGRVARLGGGSAILKIGAHGKTELADKRTRAEKAFRVLTGMLDQGCVPGGGVSYLACRAAVEALHDCDLPSGHEHGLGVLLAALEAPFLQIVANESRINPRLALEMARRLGCRVGVDVLTGEYVDMREQGIVDSLRVAQGALQLAASAASSVITTGVVVLPPPAKRALRTRP